MKKRIDEIQESARIIDDIADKLIEDHIEMMNENRALLAEIEKKDAEIEALRSELALVAAHEREACARVCDETRYKGYCPPEDGAAPEYYDAAAESCADAIRARGEK